MPHKDPIKHKEYQKKYRAEHRDRRKEYLREYRNRPGIKERKVIRQQERLARKPWAKTLGYIQKRCNNKDHWYFKHGIKCLLTLGDLEFLWHRDKAALMQTPSIDRRNGGHYTLENCRYIELLDNQSREKWRENK